MKIQTFSIVTGTTTCNAMCPYCVSKMTPTNGIDYTPGMNWRNLRKACQLAKIRGVTTVLITGKGEPTLYPEQLTDVLRHLSKFEFPLIELQTNGIVLGDEPEKYNAYLREWYDLGVTLISVSVVHYKENRNEEIFQSYRYPKLDELVKNLHEHKLSVRLSCTMIKDYVDTADEVGNLITYARQNKVEQLSIRKLCCPLSSDNREVFKWVKEHQLTPWEMGNIKEFLDTTGTKLMTLESGIVYDVWGQNVCLTDALTLNPESDNLRQMIFFPDGHIRYDWQYPGAILL